MKPGYTQTDVGVIPEEWEVSDLQGACKETITYGIVQCGPHIKDGIPYIRVSDIDEPELDVDRMLRTSKSIAAKFFRSTVKEGDLVYALRGKIGEVRQVRRDVAGANLTQGTARLSPSERMAGGYLIWAMRNPQSLRQAEMEAKGTTFREITLADLRHIKVLIPPLAEQRAIAEALSDVDGLLGSLDRLIAKKRDIKQAAMQQLLTGQTRLPGFHGEWEGKTVAELEKVKLVKLSRGQVISKKDIDNTPGDFPIYSSSIHNEGLFGRYGDFMFDEEMITWSIDGGGNFFHRRKHRFSVTNVCGYMRVDTSRIDYRFFTAELQLLHSRKSFDYQSKAHPSVVRKEYAVQLPPLPEQTAIAEVLTDMDTELAGLEQRREKTRALKQAMMQELLTGRTRLTIIP